jgi:hypothetical protein
MIVKDSGNGGTFEQAPIGTHVARCVKLIDIGTHRGEYQGQVTFKRQIIVGWELPNELLQRGEYAGQPFLLSKFYTASLNEKSTLRQHLKSWRGRDFTDQELQAFDLKNILGAPCMVSVLHKEKDGKAAIGGVMALPKGMQVPEQINPSVYFSLDSFDAQVFEGLSDGMKKLIAVSPEYQQATNPAFASQAQDHDGQPFNDDCPF